jgi:hypothetical protein
VIWALRVLSILVPALVRLLELRRLEQRNRKLEKLLADERDHGPPQLEDPPARPPEAP